MANKNITLYEQGSNRSVEVYPKTTVEQVVGLGAQIEGLAPVTLNNYDFGSETPLDAGTYIITNPTNSPFENENGVLRVVSTGNNSTMQLWNGKKYIAYREFGTFNPLVANVESLQVNGVTVNTAITENYNAQGVKFTYEQRDTVNFNSGKIMWLYPGKTYTLSGVLLNCQIRVGYLEEWYKEGTTDFQAKTFDEQKDDAGTTTIILNNFYHKVSQDLAYDASDADSWEAAIGEYGPLIMSEICGKTKRRGKLVIELAAGSKNYLVREMSQTMDTANNKWGVIYSEQDLDIQGTGSLGITDGQDNEHLMGCHAIKAKGIFKIHDTPHIVGRAYHDLLHGNDGLYVDGGYFQALYCNDILGTDTSLGDQAIGKIRLYNGIFDVRECYGTFIQADDVIVYPGVKLSFKEIGEGLFLQCAPGFYKGEITKKGQVSNFGILSYENHTYTLYTPSGVKLDAAAFESYIEDVDSVVAYFETPYDDAAKFYKQIDNRPYILDNGEYRLCVLADWVDASTTYYLMGSGSPVPVTYSKESKFKEALVLNESKQPYVLVNDEYVLCERGHTFDPDHEIYYNKGTGAGIKIMYNGVETDVPAAKVVTVMPGIIVYSGFTVTPDSEYVYSESNRNTHFADLVNGATEPDGGWNYNLTFSYTPTSTAPASGETTLEAAAALVSEPLNISDAGFAAIDYAYTGTVSGGVWNIGMTEQKLTEYRNEVDYLLTCVKGMLVPPKEIDIIGTESAQYNIITGAYTTTGVTNTRDDDLFNEGDEIAAGSIINGQRTPNKIKEGGAIYTSKTTIEPTFHLKVGEALLVKAELLPADTTNFAMKWSMVGINDWISIARLVTDDTMGCYVRGLQPGEEDIIVSAKALSKDNVKVKLKLHFIVDEPTNEEDQRE